MPGLLLHIDNVDIDFIRTNAVANVCFLSQIAELLKLWSEVQREFGESFKDLRKHFEMIVEGERRHETARAALDASDAKLGKTRKEMKKATKAKMPDGDIREIEKRLDSLERDREKHQIDVFDTVRENEIVKMIRIKDGLLKTAQSYIDMVRKGDVLFSAAKFIAQQIPDVGDREIHEIKYTGSGVTMQAVIDAKQRISHYSRDDENYSQQQASTAYTFNTGDAVRADGSGDTAGSAISSESVSTAGGAASSPHPAELPPPYSVDPPTNPFYDAQEEADVSDASFVVSPNTSASATTGGRASGVGGGGGLYPRLSGSFHTPPSRPPPPPAGAIPSGLGQSRRHSEAAGLQNRRRSSSASGLQDQSRRGLSASLVADVGSGIGGLQMR